MNSRKTLKPAHTLANIPSIFLNKQRKAYVRVALLAVLTCGFCAVAAGQITISKYLNDDGHGNCAIWGGSDNVCASLDVSVGSDATPGDYTYDLRCNPDIIGGGGNYVATCCGYGHGTIVHVNADHTYSLNPDSGLACMTNAGGRGLSQLYLSVAAPSGSIHSEGSLSFNIQTLYCQSPIEVDTIIPVQIGSVDNLTPDPNATKPDDPNTDCGGGAPMANYFIHLMLVSLHIQDTPISYNSPRGPATAFKVSYNHKEANQPTTFPFSNLGPKWTFNWLSYVTDDPANSSANATVYVRGGGTETYTGFTSGTQSYVQDPQSMAVLVRTSSTSYEKRFPGGSKEVFAVSDGSTSYPRRVFMTSVIDAAGNTTTISYDSSLRITTITDSLGQAITLNYALSGDPLKITTVTDPFGRYATFDYTSGQLTRITDPVGIQSQFTYATGTDFINAMTTPYGTTTFAKGENGNAQRWLEATDPLGGKERVEYNNSVASIPWSEGKVPAGAYNRALQRQNTFYWNKKAMADYPGDYTKAQIFHWLSTADGKVSGIKHSEKPALESRIWYTYNAQPNGGTVGTT